MGGHGEDAVKGGGSEYLIGEGRGRARTMGEARRERSSRLMARALNAFSALRAFRALRVRPLRPLRALHALRDLHALPAPCALRPPWPPRS